MRLLYLIMLICSCTELYAQDCMRIHYKNGGHTDVSIVDIDSLTFVKRVDDDVHENDASLRGSWLWGSQEAGYYELLTFNDDHTYTGYDNYFMYGFDTQTYGWYSQHGVMLTLQSNGFGYQRRYNWYVTALTENALEVMTKMGAFIYYKLQPEAIRMQVGNTLSYEDEGVIIFVDGVIVKSESNNLVGATPGVTYMLKREQSSNTIYAYKVIIE